MTLKELLELAHLDALDLLDEQEKNAFEHAFASAPPGVRAQVRAEQERWATMEPLLPRIEPPPDLKDRVLAAVEQAMIRDEALGGPSSIDLLPGTRVSARWRTASVALMTAVVALTVAFVHVYRINADTREAIEAGGAETSRLYVWGNSVALRDSLFDSRVAFTYFRPVSETSGARASLALHPDWEVGKFFCLNIAAPAGQTLRLCVVDEKNNVFRELSEFESDGTLKHVDVSMGSASVSGTRLAIALAPRDRKANASDIIMLATVA